MDDSERQSCPRGAHRPLLRAVRDAARDGDPATLALVLETQGSTYVAAGAMALFGARDGQVGWLSGGCLEPAIEAIANAAADAGRIDWMEVDTRDDEDLLSGSALGCRGRLRLALLPLARLRGLDELLDDWLGGGAALDLDVRADGAMTCAVGTRTLRWTLPAATPAWAAQEAWSLRVPAAPEVLVFGGGPETPMLLPLLRDTGWRVTLAERRPRWREQQRHADHHLDLTPRDAARVAACEAALVMHHNFELDREALQALAATATPFIGLLGPVRRREDLFRVLPEDDRAALLPRLHSPIGLPLGGHGPQAIALSIAAQLQAWLHGRDAM